MVIYSFEVRLKTCCFDKCALRWANQTFRVFVVENNQANFKGIEVPDTPIGTDKKVNKLNNLFQ